MAEKVPLDDAKGFVVGKPEAVISTIHSDISVSVVDQDGIERENVYPDTVPSDAIAVSTAADLSLPATLPYQEKFTEQLDDIRTKPYLKEVEFELKGPDFNWPPSFLGSLRVKVTRGLKIIKSYKKEVK